MDSFLSRYRNITVLMVVIVAQLMLIAYQIRTNKDVPLIRVWAVTTVTPVEQALEVVRRNTWGFAEDYFVLLGVRSQNEKLKSENGALKMENHYLKAELSTADRAQALSVFQAHSPSKTLAAREIGFGTGANSKTIYVDRGSVSGVENGMAVVTPDGIVGKVLNAYPTASLVMLITDPTFAAGVISQKNHVRGTLKGQGHGDCLVDYAQNEEKVDIGEMFYTSGDDRIFPKGFPVGQVRAVRNGKTFKEIYLMPSGMQGGVEEVLIILQGEHQQIPEAEVASSGYKILAPPPETNPEAPQSIGQNTVLATDADRLREQYKQAGETQKHTFGEPDGVSKPPDFTKIPGIRVSAQPPPSAPAPVPATVKPNTPPAATPGRGATVAATPPGTRPVRSDTSTAPGAAPPKVKPRPTTPILVTDPTDADPDMAPPPAPKTATPAPKRPNP